MAEIPKGGAKASGSEKSRSNSNIRRNDVSPLPHRFFSFLDARISFFIFTSFATLPTRACKFFFSSSIFSLFTSCHALLPFRLFFLSLFLSSFFFPSSFSSLCTASFQTCAQASTFLLAAFIAPACALITPYTRLRSYRGIKFDLSICT